MGPRLREDNGPEWDDGGVRGTGGSRTAPTAEERGYPVTIFLDSASLHSE